ncbi:MAG: nucleotide exchange factor GrpE [Phycisphaeraceae bacterium]|nr:nucleotide exchange factor GrpE [Phycisphaeraceae bacterium]
MRLLTILWAWLTRLSQRNVVNAKLFMHTAQHIRVAREALEMRLFIKNNKSMDPTIDETILEAKPNPSDHFCDQDVAVELDGHFDDLLEGLPLEESIVSRQLADIQRDCQAQNEGLKSVITLLESLQKQDCEHDKHDDYLEIVAECQRLTANYANDTVERHALHPAIEAVFDLTNMLHDLAAQFTDLDKCQINPLVRLLLNSISEAVKVANNKCDHLDIVKIVPQDLDAFDADKHQIRQTETTDESDRHKKIKTTLVPGLTYRGKVLREAKVCIYRYVKN